MDDFKSDFQKNGNKLMTTFKNCKNNIGFSREYIRNLLILQSEDKF